MKDKNTIKERYDELGGSLYDLRYSEEQKAKYELVLAELDQPSLLLDNGCGTGLLFPLLDCAIVGLDLSSKLLEKAKERTNLGQYLVQGDSEHLPLRDNVFDAQVSVTVIQNLSNPVKFLEESVRVAKQGSTVIISSLKRVYSREEITRLIINDELSIKKVFTSENVNDWITVSTRKNIK